MATIHREFGLTVAGVFLLIAIWGLAAWIRNKDPGPWFWRLLAAGQVGVGGQVLLGIILLSLGRGRPLVHYAYGLFPILVLLVAHRYARRVAGVEWAVFAIAGLVNFGLLFRGFLTGSAA